MVRRHTARNQRRNHRTGTGNRTHVYTFANALAHQIERRVCHTGRSRITHERNVTFILQEFHITGSHLFLVEIMVRLHRSVDTVIVEQHPRMASVFGKHQRHFLQNPHGAVSDIFHVPDRGRDDIKSMHNNTYSKNRKSKLFSEKRILYPLKK